MQKTKLLLMISQFYPHCPVYLNKNSRKKILELGTIIAPTGTSVEINVDVFLADIGLHWDDLQAVTLR